MVAECCDGGQLNHANCVVLRVSTTHTDVFRCSVAVTRAVLHPVRMGPSAAAAQEALVTGFEAAVHRVATALPALDKVGALPTAAQVPCPRRP